MQLPPELRERPFTAQQAHDAGLNRYWLRRLVNERVLHRILHGVYAPSSLPDTLTTRTWALELVVPPNVVICDRTAAWLHGVDTFAFRELEILPPIETCVFPDATRVRRRGCIGRSRDLAPPDMQRVGTLVVTTPLRTALDLGCLFSRREAMAALDGLLRAQDLTIAELVASLPRYRGRRGVVQLRQLAPLASGLAESPGESWTRITIIDAGLPIPEPQVWVLDRGSPLFRLDLAYPKHKVLVEYDGREFHESKEQEDADRARRKWLRDRGWTVIVVTKEDFTPDAVAAWTQELREALHLAS